MLLERLGRRPDARLVIVTLEGLGSSNASNNGIQLALSDRSGRAPLASCVTVQVPCPWARGGADLATSIDGLTLGIELTLNCAPTAYRWASLTRSPSLTDGDGSLPTTVGDLLEHADTPEVLKECRAQISRAVQWGLEPNFLTSHLDALAYRPEFFDVLIELAVEYSLPVRLPDPAEDLGFDARELAAREGVLTPDYVVRKRSGGEVRDAAAEALRNLRPGVTEIVARPAADCDELRALTPEWAARVGDAHLVTHDWGFRALVDRSGAELISWAELHGAQNSPHRR